MNRPAPSEEPAVEAALCREIIESARQRAAERIHSAEQQAAQGLESARNEAAGDVSAYFSEIEREANHKRAAILASIPMEVRRLQAARREAELDAIRDAALERLRRRDAAVRRADLLRVIPPALASMEGTAFVLRLSAADSSIAEGPFLGHIADLLAPRAVRLGVVIDPDMPPGGILLEEESGRQRWDNTLEARCSRLWPELRQRVATSAGWLIERQRS